MSRHASPVEWTEGRTGALIALWREGKSGRQVADALNIRSRNAVMGKLFRLGLLGSRRAERKAWNESVFHAPPAAPRRFSWEQHA